MNGIPVLFFSSSSALSEELLTDSLGTFSTFAKDGPNFLTVEARPEKGQAQATTTVSAIATTGSLSDLDKPPLFKETITGSGKSENTIVLKNVPRWAFLEVQPFAGNKDDVLTAVRALHKAFADHDAKTLQAAFKPMYDDLLPYMGEALGSPAQFAAQMTELATNSKVEPLPADLKVESGYGDRLFIVTTPSGKAPIQAASRQLSQDGKPQWTMHTGMYWIHRTDGWFVIRR